MMGRYTVYHRMCGVWKETAHTYSKYSEAYRTGCEIIFDARQRFAIRSNISGVSFIYNSSGELVEVVL